MRLYYLLHFNIFISVYAIMYIVSLTEYVDNIFLILFAYIGFFISCINASVSLNIISDIRLGRICNTKIW